MRAYYPRIWQIALHILYEPRSHALRGNAVLDALRLVYKGR